MSGDDNLDAGPDRAGGAAGSPDLHDLAAAYALNALDDVERTAFEPHLAGCAGCRSDVAELSETSLALSAGLEEEPPPALRAQLLAQISTTPQDTARPDHDTTPDVATSTAPSGSSTDELADRRAARHRRPGRLNRWAVAAAAAAAAAVIAITLTQWPRSAPDPDVVAAQEVLDAPDAIRSSAPLEGGSVTVVTAYSVDRSVVLTEDLGQAPEGKDYQLWFVGEDGATVSAGVLPRDSDEFLLEGEPGEAVAVGITLEPTGGSEQPTSEPLVAVPLEG